MMITDSISQCILTIGEKYKNHKGGIAAVINTYSKYFPHFKFIPTYKPVTFKLYGIPYFIFGLFLITIKLTHDKRIQVVHIHGAAKGSIFRKYMVFLITHYVYRRKVIYHCHGSEFKLFYDNSGLLCKKIIQHFMNNVDLIICLSRQWELFFSQNFNNKNIRILENIVEQPINAGARKSNKGVLKFLFLGKIGDRKGIFDLLDVLRDHKQELDGTLQLIIGGNGDVRRLQEYININGLHSIVRFEGWIDGSRKQALLAESDVYILPSYNEGLPISILEAISYQLPVITTSVGGITEVVYDNFNGFIVEPGDKAAIYDRLKRFINNPELATHMGEASRSIIKPYFPEAVILKLEDIYNTLILKR
ncbi:glycosyltransferase family 4 protein [Pontibacter populi]|uniref:Glycosyltransferase family 4 protein n=1 Tax=Pontibacter populi TaxID=890055 RepID=A0ABV1RX73_9BACT